ncbi:MAG: hypothetical protein ACREA0_03640 [bacterium]
MRLYTTHLELEYNGQCIERFERLQGHRAHRLPPHYSLADPQTRRFSWLSLSRGAVPLAHVPPHLRRAV